MTHKQSNHYGFWCLECSMPIYDGQQIFDGPVHVDCACRRCHAPLSKCPNNGDCMNPRLPIRNRYSAKDQAKSNLATKFVGRGSSYSSTNAYAAAWSTLANTGTYAPHDVVFISAEGARSGRIPPDFHEIHSVIAAGATIITDAPHDRLRPYNLGEREVAAYLTSNGYHEVAPGRWQPHPQRQHPTLSFSQFQDSFAPIAR